MEVKIGVVHTVRELTVELDGDASAIERLFSEALAGDDPILWLVDKRGRRVGVPSDKIAYVEFGEDEDRRVGFART